MPKPVLGGLSLPLFGLVAAAGVSILGRQSIGGRERLILALSLGLGVGVMLAPETVARAAFVPQPLQPLLQSGFAVGGLSALVLNLLLPPAPDRSV
jgi:xanthine/uracil permease